MAKPAHGAYGLRFLIWRESLAVRAKAAAAGEGQSLRAEAATAGGGQMAAGKGRDGPGPRNGRTNDSLKNYDIIMCDLQKPFEGVSRSLLVQALLAS